MIVESKFCMNKAVATMTAMSRIRPLEISGSVSAIRLCPCLFPAAARGLQFLQIIRPADD